MKQIINKWSNGDIHNKHYINHLDQANGIAISYYYNGNMLYKRNYLNDKRFGIENYYNNNGKPTNITYHL